MANKKKKNAKSRLVRLMNSETGYYYIAYKSRTAGETLKFKKYDPVLRKHVLFTETKIK